MNARRAYVSGVVQGVAFRWHTREKALELGVRGWVRNLRDGRVEVLADGDEDALERLFEWLSRGPAAARVSGLEEVPTGAEQAGDGFEILPTVSI